MGVGSYNRFTSTLGKIATGICSFEIEQKGVIDFVSFGPHEINIL